MAKTYAMDVNESFGGLNDNKKITKQESFDSNKISQDKPLK